MPGTEAAAPIETDALIVGAGPVGLFQVFELGLLEVRAEVVDSLPHAGASASSSTPRSPSTTSRPCPIAPGAS